MDGDYFGTLVPRSLRAPRPIDYRQHSGVLRCRSSVREVGFPGTFPLEDFIFPTAMVTQSQGLASHNGNLIAFTKNSTYVIDDDFMSPKPISTGVGLHRPTLNSSNS